MTFCHTPFSLPNIEIKTTFQQFSQNCSTLERFDRPVYCLLEQITLFLIYLYLKKHCYLLLGE